MGEERLHSLLDEYKEEKIANALKELRKRAEKMMRQHIGSLPNETISVEDYLDNDGVTDDPLTLAIDLTIKGDKMTIDFSRSSSACAGPVNISKSTTIAAPWL